MTRFSILAVALAMAAQTTAAGPADTAPKRPGLPTTAADVASAHFSDQDKISRPRPASAEGRLVISTHGPTGS
jgi:hypothetical protein